MKKVLYGMTGIAVIALLLAALGEAALASPVASISSDGPVAQVSVDEPIKEAPVSIVQDEVTAQALTDDDDPEDEHAERGCGGYVDPDKLALKIAAAAEFLGLAPEEIAAQVEAGKRLYEIAEEQGVDLQAFRDTVHAAIGAEGGCGCGSH